MKDRKLAVRYARALFAAFPDPARNEPIARLLTNIARSFEADPVLRDRMLDPAIPRATRSQALTTLARQSGLPQGVSNFLRTLVDNNRIAVIPSIAAVFEEIREDAMGIVPAEITTAAPLSEQQRQRARDAVQKLTGRQVRLICSVAPEMIGGAVTRIGSTIYDGSLRTQLNLLRRQMAEE
jgi:F-type H+-transporting ATPase subunit delta